MSVLSQRQSIILDQGISAPGHVKEVVDGINDIYKCYMYQLMSTVQLPGSKIFERHIIMHSCTPKKDVSLDKGFQIHLSNDDCKHVVIDQGENRKRSSKRKWTDIEYHFQDNYDVAHKYVKMYCDTNQLPALTSCGSHSNPCGARNLGKHYHICFDPNLGNGICEIRRTPCACVTCTSMLDQPWISVVQFKKIGTLPTRHKFYLFASSGLI